MPDKKNIYQRIHAVMQDVKKLKKDLKVSYPGTNYKAVSEEAVTTAVRESMIKHGLVMYPEKIETVLHFVTTQKGASQYLDEMNVTYKIVNIDDPKEFILVPSRAHGIDTQDKAPGKAMTYAAKYALLRVFMIPTGDDPDNTSSKETTAKVGAAKKVEPKKAPRGLMQQRNDFVALCEKSDKLDEIKKAYQDLPLPIKKDVEVINAKEAAKQRLAWEN